MERAFGIIAIRKNQEKWETLLVLHQKGHWGFPKGHAEPGESPQETAKRELQEEVGGDVLYFFNLDPLEEEYSYTLRELTVHKKNTYFFAKIQLIKEEIQVREIKEIKWVSFEEAEELATFKESKKIAKEARNLLEHI